MGHKYLIEGQYEEAALAFEKVITIDDRNVEAYAGGIKAYINIGDERALIDLYDRALIMIEGLDEEFLKQNMDYVVEIYLSADRVYYAAPDQTVEVLEKGWNITERLEIRDKLKDSYLVIVDKIDEIHEYRKEMEIYERLLELAGDDETILESFEKSLVCYVDFLMEEGEYDEIRALAKKYGEMITSINFNKLLKQIEESEIVAEDNTEVQEIKDETLQGGLFGDDWVDDLYRKIVTEDVDGIFTIMEQSDFIVKCGAYPHMEVAWSTDYNLLTNDGEAIWVVKAKEGNFLAIAYYPNGYNYGAPSNANGDILGAPAVGVGDYVYEINYDGSKSWFTKTVGYRNDGSNVELLGDIWEVFHM